jgi:arsenate reductase
MAEGLLRHMAADRFDVFSAGVEPKEVNPLAIAVMKELSIDISKQKSKSVNEFVSQKFDYIITLCDNAKQTCPFFPGKAERLHWDLEDPAAAVGSEEERLAVFRRIQAAILENIYSFINAGEKKE